VEEQPAKLKAFVNGLFEQNIDNLDEYLIQTVFLYFFELFGIKINKN